MTSATLLIKMYELGTGPRADGSTIRSAIPTSESAKTAAKNDFIAKVQASLISQHLAFLL